MTDPSFALPTLGLMFVLAFGLSFQLPVALTLMGKAGLVSAAGLASMRRYAVVLILVLAAWFYGERVKRQALTPALAVDAL